MVRQFKTTRAMQEMQADPRYKKMQEKYKNDKDKFAQEQMKLYKEFGVNPMSSCLPTLIQLPLILGLYQSVTRAMAASPYEMVNLEQIVYPRLLDASKILPLQNQFLWMDLGQPERITIFGLAIPFLAILVVATTFLQSRLIQPPSTGDDQAAMISNSMSIYMPILMGFMAYSLASGLAIYFLTSNIVGIVQYAILGRANWSNIIPFLKKKEEEKPGKKKPEVVDAKAKDVKEAEKLQKTLEKKTGDKSKRTTTKQMRPQMKKKKRN
jgi:YidC/Oxa1 family membrane protein insertase